MILMSHSVVGVAAARIASSNPILAFALAFTSHFLADMVPHWDYKLSKNTDPQYSEKILLNKDLLIDVAKVGSDIIFGATLSYFIFYGESPWLIAVGILGGILPDIFQFLYGKFGFSALAIFKKLHDKVHSERLENRTFFGIITQIITVSLIFFIYYFLAS